MDNNEQPPSKKICLDELSAYGGNDAVVDNEEIPFTDLDGSLLSKTSCTTTQLHYSAQDTELSVKKPATDTASGNNLSVTGYVPTTKRDTLAYQRVSLAETENVSMFPCSSSVMVKDNILHRSTNVTVEVVGVDDLMSETLLSETKANQSSAHDGRCINDDQRNLCSSSKLLLSNIAVDSQDNSSHAYHLILDEPPLKDAPEKNTSNIGDHSATSTLVLSSAFVNPKNVSPVNTVVNFNSRVSSFDKLPGAEKNVIIVPEECSVSKTEKMTTASREQNIVPTKVNYYSEVEKVSAPNKVYDIAAVQEVTIPNPTKKIAEVEMLIVPITAEETANVQKAVAPYQTDVISESEKVIVPKRAVNDTKVQEIICPNQADDVAEVGEVIVPIQTVDIAVRKEIIALSPANVNVVVEESVYPNQADDFAKVEKVIASNQADDIADVEEIIAPSQADDVVEVEVGIGIAPRRAEGAAEVEKIFTPDEAEDIAEVEEVIAPSHADDITEVEVILAPNPADDIAEVKEVITPLHADNIVASETLDTKSCIQSVIMNSSSRADVNESLIANKLCKDFNKVVDDIIKEKRVLQSSRVDADKSDKSPVTSEQAETIDCIDSSSSNTSSSSDVKVVLEKAPLAASTDTGILLEFSSQVDAAIKEFCSSPLLEDSNSLMTSSLINVSASRVSDDILKEADNFNPKILKENEQLIQNKTLIQEGTGISIVSMSPKTDVENVSPITISEEKNEDTVCSKTNENEPMEVDVDQIELIPSEKLDVDSGGDLKSSAKDLLAADNSIFVDEESYEPILRKPEPVSYIREETLAGDPRFDISEVNSISTTPLPVEDASELTQLDASAAASPETKDKLDDDDDLDDSEDDTEGASAKKLPKKRRKPRRSMFYRKRDRKKKDAKEGDTTNSSVIMPVEIPIPSPVANIDEDSQGSTSNREKKEVRRFRCEVVVPESTEAFTVDKVMEYVWPLEGGYGEHYFVQEHISQYIGISSFKRKYPDLRRRPIDMAERDHLKELGAVSETACDMGLTAVRSEDLMDVLFADFPAKFEELSAKLRERSEKQLKERGKVEYTVADIDKSKVHEYSRRAAEDAAMWNAALNREKREERRFSFDLQTFTLHKPQGQGIKLSTDSPRVAFYPVAVLPGQFTDNYRVYSSTDLFRMPLNTVCVGPIANEPVKRERTSSDQSLIVKPLGSKNGVSVVQIKSEECDEKPLKCKICQRGKDSNKSGKAEGLIVCAKCSSTSHASCVDLNPTMIPRINSYGWQCMDCKCCMQCSSSEDEDKMIFCDLCDRGYHIYCVGLRKVPNGRWHCKECAVCDSCGARNPAGGENVKSADWQHEFKKNRDNNKVAYATTLCVPCDRLWKKRQFCYVCLKVYRSIPEDNMVRCSSCPKYVHKDNSECSTLFDGAYMCTFCFKSSNKTLLNHNRILAAAKRKMLSSGY